VRYRNGCNGLRSMTSKYRAHIMKRFPYLEKALNDKLDASDDFRALCQDYFDAVEALTRWEDSANPTEETKARIVEYRRLVQNLESDVLLELYRPSIS
jgi:hypothetical protein